MSYIKLAALAFGAAAVGLYIYFDRKRKSDPNYRRNIGQLKNRQRKGVPGVDDQIFMQELRCGEILISQGEVERGVGHLTRALMVCGDPERLLCVMQSTLPKEVYKTLINEVCKTLAQDPAPALTSAPAPKSSSAWAPAPAAPAPAAPAPAQPSLSATGTIAA